MLTKGAIGNLINRYRAVLKKCSLINTFGSLAVAGMLVMGGAGLAVAEEPEYPGNWNTDSLTIGSTGTSSVTGGGIDLTTNGTNGNDGNNLSGNYGKNVRTEKLFIRDGGTLTLGSRTENQRVVHYQRNGGTQPSAASGITIPGMGMVVEMSGGTVAITSKDPTSSASEAAVTAAAEQGTFDFSSLDVNTFKLTGGDITLTGNPNSTRWDEAAYIGAYNGMDIGSSTAATTITMNANSELFAGNHLNISGANTTITMKGAKAVDGEYGKFDAQTAHIMFAASGNNTISGGNITVAVNSSGVLSAKKLNMTGGTLTVAEGGALLLQPNSGESDIVYTGGATSDFNLSGSATVKVEEGGLLWAPYTQINQTGGTLTVNGALRTEKPKGDADGTANHFAFLRSGYTLSSGILNIEGNAQAIDKGNGAVNGNMQVGKLLIEGDGRVTIGATKNNKPNQWDQGPFLGGELGTTMTGGTVTLGNYGELYGGVDAPGWSAGKIGEMNLSGGDIFMTGKNTGSGEGRVVKGSVLYAAANQNWGSTVSGVNGAEGYVALNLSGTNITVGTENAPADGYIVAREINMSGGSITVNSGSTLTVAGGAKKGNNEGFTPDIEEGIQAMVGDPSEPSGGGAGAGASVAALKTTSPTPATPAPEFDETFTLSGGEITVASGGSLDFAKGKVDLVLTGGGKFNYTQAADSGYLIFNDLTLAGGTLNLTDVDTLTVGTNPEDLTSTKGVYVDDTLQVGDSNNTHDLTLTTLNQVKGHDSNVRVANGSLTVNHLNQTFEDAAGAAIAASTPGTPADADTSLITVGGQGAVGTLTVKDSLTNVEYAAGQKGILVANLGTLVAGKNVLLKTAAVDNYAKLDTVQTIGVAAGGTLKITGLDNQTITDAQLTDIKAIMSATANDGMLDLGNAKLDVVAEDATEITADTAKTLGNVETTATLGLTVTNADNTQPLKGGYKNVEVKEDAGTAAEIKTESGTLRLAGDTSNGNLVAKGNTVAAVIVGKSDSGDNAALTLGVETADNSGKVGDVTLTTQSGSAGGTATLNAEGKGNASFETGAIKVNGQGATAVNASGASLESTKIGDSAADKAVTTVNATNGGKVISTSSINADNLAADQKGSVVSAGSTITADNLSAANGGTVQAATGITVTNAVTGLNDGTIKTTNGTVTLNGGATNASGTIEAGGTTGEIKAEADGGTKQDILAAAGKDLTLSATQGTITAKDITATNVEAKTLTASGAVSVTNGTLKTANDSTVGSLTLDNNAEGTVGKLTVNSTGTTTLTNGASLEAKELDAGSGATTLTNGASLTAEKLTAADSAVSVTDGKLNITATDAAAASAVKSLALDGSTGTVAGQLTVSTTAALTNGSVLHADTLIMSSGGTNNLTVGSANDTKGGTTLVVKNLTLDGNSLLIDPAWESGGVALPSTNVAVEHFGGDPVAKPDVEIDGNVGVGRNSMAAIGTGDENWLRGHVNAVTNNAGLTENGVTAALGIVKPTALQNATNNGLEVNGIKTTDTFGSSPNLGTPTAGKLIFADNSLLVVTAEAADNDGNGALSFASSTGTAEIIGNAKLRIEGAEVGETYKVLGKNISQGGGGNGITKDDPDAWSGDNLSTDSAMVELGNFNKADGTIEAKLKSASKNYPLLDSELANVVDAGYLAHEIGTDDQYVNAEDKGVRFLSRATSDKYIGKDAEQVAVTMESAARMALIGAVPQMTLAANNAAGNAVTQRTSLAQPGGNAIQSMAADGSVSGSSATNVAKTGFALWIMPLYQSANGWGLEGGNFDLDYSGGLGGVAIGADYTFDNAIRAGITFNIGGGYASGSGDFNETTNNMTFWGIGAYAGWTMNNFGLTADVNYTSTYNELEQELPAAMQMDSLKSDVTAWAISVGLRGEYKIETSALDITPHVGVRYTSLNTDEYDVTSGGTVLTGDAISQSIWTFPVGVAFSKQIDTGNGWHFKPSLDLAVIPAAGDIKARGDVRFTGVSGTAELETQTMDYISYMGQAGLEFGNDNVSFGVNYNLQTGVNSTSHGVFGTFRYEF
ncbi:autotransporter domain-containing protein [Desulfovibrio sp. ZJ369]|uniref:autotransporter domain-containing protein n=1 Tax=Desulfovibrio sp. ZJ369 TaxID=2709793 RepID=UPI0013EC23BC|nr:autotransporter domain-containing protein [Desulfovibrio sp. ZJ369]